MSEMSKLVRLQARGWRSNPLVGLAFLLGLNFMLTPTLNYIRYAKSLGQPIHILEPLTVAGSMGSSFMLIFLGVLLLLSDAPFVNDFSQSVLLRTSRMKWAAAYLLYIALCCFAYCLLLLVFSLLVAMPNAYADDVWSYPMMQLAAGRAGFVEGVSFFSVSFLQKFTPVQGGLITLAFQISYGFVLGAAMFFFNMVFHRVVGTVLALCAHVAGVIIYVEGIEVNPYLSLMIHAMPSAHNISGNPSLNVPTLRESMLLWAALALVLVLCTLLRCKRFDFMVPDRSM